MVSVSSAEQAHTLQQNEDPRFSIKRDMTPLFIVSATFYNLIVRQGLVKQKIKCKHISVQETVKLCVSHNFQVFDIIKNKPNSF